MGGIYPTFFPEHAIANPDVDSICIGEGYEALYELCQIIEKQQGNKVYNIKNLWVKDATYPNNIHKNPMRPPIDINTIPFDDFDLFEPKRHYRPMFGKMLKILPFWFDIGCPYNCTYCSAPQLKRIYKEGGHKYGRVKNIDRITEENTAILKEMGCSRISIGLESGNEEYRMNILNKRFTNDQFLRSANILKLNGIKFTTNNIIGLPDETREMVFDTIELNRQITNWSNDVNQVISTYVPTGGTDLQKYCLEKGYFNLDEYLNMPYGGFHISIYLNMPQLPPKDVVGLLRTFPMYVRFDKDRWDEIKLAETDDMVYKNLMVEYWNNLR
jgi:radical SAM superfamily enzyme YgiQ (UPF0313 family)